MLSKHVEAYSKKYVTSHTHVEIYESCTVLDMLFILHDMLIV
jgi:hypothetical protein